MSKIALPARKPKYSVIMLLLCRDLNRPISDFTPYIMIWLVSSDGSQYLLTVINRYTRHLEVVPLKDTSAKTVADAFIFHWVARFGCPAEITCDRGSQFKSNLWAEMYNFLGCKLNLTCSYRPQCNGII